MYFGEASIGELTHLDERVANIIHMNWGWFSMLLHKRVTTAKMEAMQMWWWRGWSAWLEAKVGARGAGVQVRHLCCCDTFEQRTWILLSSCDCCQALRHQDVSLHHLILLLNAWMIWLITARKSLDCNSCKRYTWTTWPEGQRMAMSLTWREDHPPCLTLHPTYCHYGLEHATLFLLSMWNALFSQFSTKIKSWVSSLSDVWSKYQKG